MHVQTINNKKHNYRESNKSSYPLKDHKIDGWYVYRNASVCICLHRNKYTVIFSLCFMMIHKSSNERIF
jgi:hypothetical protein